MDVPLQVDAVSESKETRAARVVSLQELIWVIEELTPPRPGPLRRLSEEAIDLTTARDEVAEHVWALGDDDVDLSSAFETLLQEHNETLERMFDLDALADDVQALARDIKAVVRRKEQVEDILNELEADDDAI